MVLFFVAMNNASPKDEAGVTAGSKPAATAGSKPVATDSAGVTVDAPTDTEAEAAPNDREPVAVAGFTKYEALGETWVSVGLVLTGLSGGSQELTITLLDAAGTPLATTTDYVGSDRDGGEVLVSSGFTDNTPTVASVRVDLSNASSFIDATPFPVTVLSQGFDGNFWTVKGTATNNGSENIDFGSITCVAFKAGLPVAGVTTSAATMVPGAPIAFDTTETFDPQADEVRCQGEGR
jgi:hypothetical protein